MNEFGFTRIFPKIYLPDRTKESYSVIELLEIERLFHEAAIQLIGEELAERLRLVTKEIRNDKELLHIKRKYPFSWSCIVT